MKNASGGKSFRVLQTIEKLNQGVPQGNDENATPCSNQMEQQKQHHSANEQNDLGAVKQVQLGKQLHRVAAVKAAGGRRGLSEQLKRVRRFEEK